MDPDPGGQKTGIKEVFLCVRYLDALCDVVEHVDGLPGDTVANKKPTQKNPLKKTH